MWPEVMRAISESLPHDPDSQRSVENLKPDQLRDMLMASKRIEIDSLDCEHYPKLEDWFADVHDKWLEGQPDALPTPAAGASASAGAPVPGAPPAGAAPAPLASAPPGAVPPVGGLPGATPSGVPRRHRQLGRASPWKAPGQGRLLFQCHQAPATPQPANPAAGPTGEGWVIQITGHHYHNNSPGNEGSRNMCGAPLIREIWKTEP